MPLPRPPSSAILVSSWFEKHFRPERFHPITSAAATMTSARSATCRRRPGEGGRGALSALLAALCLDRLFEIVKRCPQVVGTGSRSTFQQVVRDDAVGLQRVQVGGFALLSDHHAVGLHIDAPAAGFSHLRLLLDRYLALAACTAIMTRRADQTRSQTQAAPAAQPSAASRLSP